MSWSVPNLAGSQSCAECHQDIYRSFMQTPMAHSSGRAGAGQPTEQFARPEFRDSPGAFAYTVGRDSNGYYFDYRQRASNPIQGRRRLDYFVGSGAAARSYLFNVGKFLYEAPVAYYRNSESWKAAPGYAGRGYPFLTRPVLPGCLQCHASRIQAIEGTQNAYSSPPFLEGGVACERCHGAGSDHIATGAQMVNPAKIAAAERDSICEQCHLSGEIRVPKDGKDEPVLNPGTRLRDVMTVFVRSGSPSELRVTSHVENLAQSACKRASGDKLWCGSCHDPHSVPAPEQKATYFREKCLRCHETSSCKAPLASRQANADDCSGCHMPRNPTADIEHVVFTDHSIRKRPAAVFGSLRPTADLVPFWGGDASPRELGLAYAMLGVRDANSTYVERAFQLLQEVVARSEADVQTIAYLAQFYRDRKDDAKAFPLYQQAWRMDPSQYAAAAALGAYQMQRGNLEEAIRLWKEALAISPSMVLVRTNLANALLRTGRTDEAREMLEKALEFNPTSQEARNLLDRLVKPTIRP
jgi:hypothetical protein